MKQTYGIKVSTIVNATETLTDDLDYLCALVEQPDPEFSIKDAVVFSRAVMTISHHLDFIVEELSTRDLNEEQSYVKLTEKDVIALNDYNDATEEALEDLEAICGISLKSN